MKEHLVIPKDKGYKNRLLAQEFGIVIAQEYFESNLEPEAQGILFSWNKTDDFKVKSLVIHFRNRPKNIDELFSIAQESASIEFSNLKEKYGKELPVRKIDDEQAISVSTHICTTGFFMIHQNHVFKELENEIGLENARKIFNEKYTEMFVINDLKKLSIEKFTRISDAKNFNSSIQKNVLNNIDSYWSGIKNLKNEVHNFN